MQMIAATAGLPKADLHHDFPTKETLYRRVVQDIFKIWLHAADVFDKADCPAEGIGAYLGGKLKISGRHRFGAKV
ncbi:TetR family transcriptional regulator [Cereibacter ovatus]|uniref:TetR family transcriptional regulator n=1 Tax=Cereibacter ovatus TaxID=439529 RepID=A0A285D267_9RHOB|nr:hypothetical protein [Cereibacter ovatus]SNX73408.1 TetR family transcriptional regulator [Cereibacter ovatus]